MYVCSTLKSAEVIRQPNAIAAFRRSGLCRVSLKLPYFSGLFYLYGLLVTSFSGTLREITGSWNEVSSDARKKRKGAGIQALDLGQDPHLTSF